jgi:hypothetical protein
VAIRFGDPPESAIMRGFEAMLDKHPKPIYGDALQLICAIRARLEQAWLGLA